MNSDIKLLSTISALAKRCLSIYKQIQVTNWIKKKTKSSTTIQIATNVLLRAVTSSSQTPTISNNNTSFLRLSNILQGTITFTSRNLDTKTSWLIKEERCFNYKRRGHTMLNCPKKAKISTITEASHINDIENINQGKK